MTELLVTVEGLLFLDDGLGREDDPVDAAGALAGDVALA